MKKTILFLQAAVLGLLAACSQPSGEEQLRNEVQYVNPFIGTGFHGHTFPGATRPFALVQVSPDTHIMGWDASSGYHYDDSQIYAFSHTHLSGTGIGDLGDVAILPFSGGDSIRPVATFKKETEKATPGYYAVRLDNFGINVELTSTDRVGFHKYTYDNPKDRRVLLDLGHVLQPNWGHKLVGNEYLFVNDSTVEGTIRTQGWAHFHAVSYRITFSEPIETLYQYIDGNLRKDSLFLRLNTPGDLKFHYKFAENNKPLYVKVAISPVDTDGAERNMLAELPGWDFDATRVESAHIWNKALNDIQIESSDPKVMVNFYTALYHTMIAPYAYQDVDGRYLGMDKKVHRAEPGYVNYSVFSLWDTFRALHPLMTIIQPERAADWGKVLVQGYKEGGILPKWPLASSYTGCMVGYPAVSVLADLVTKELAEGDLNVWAEAGARSSVYRDDLAEKFKGTRELDLITRHPYYKEKYGFVPADSVPESVSWGLEMAYYDWCISQIAAKAGNTELAKEYAAKAEYYKRYLDPETKMMRGVMGDGSFRTPFNPRYSSHMKSDYTEGNAFQWSFFAPHDMDNFITTIGGKKELETRLDTLFTTSSQVDGEEASGDITGLIGQYAHGNEPSHHMAYLYNWTDAPWKGQERLDQIMQNFYTNEPDGIIGNEDCGQMSAWYVMSALGFYQVAPGIPVYTLGRPMIDKALIHVKGGIFEILVKNNSAANKYIKEVKLNGKVLDTPFINHTDVIKGGKLEFIMTDQPVK
ncbi:GH92 family glycosyl hydrolase [Parabacteroides johnsonii]|jgi:predicted alpha-1,2-mannosidase|uniref:Glycoside hydrolase n=2 Tax=Parabacteroides johnsonii TaxID=387661 RepID=A0A9Q5SPY0_9BACT|nr:GH92 family glycosyl hydrolase [Parabacteroides johnsonii]EEC94222.1 putative alpha-1,2-mannosidase [Parabacteroides johnsonii DSM 18315]MBX9111779.1 glycoside hydrolase family 92 protein [Parabacteroides johnsonii]OUO03614.1 glycoside hydrolase [Parabacteroides johnsonii]UEA90394.1 GH92 family glycosyl hydrolase [Parabacteroides johnsonii]UWP42562.1 GH92 family glycosyl hydrolase [Parabacteroides johnsonii DSM 18315]